MLAALALAGIAGEGGHRAGDGRDAPTDTPLFVGLLVGVIVIIGALTFFPALALGPIVEGLSKEAVLTR